MVIDSQILLVGRSVGTGVAIRLGERRGEERSWERRAEEQGKWLRMTMEDDDSLSPSASELPIGGLALLSPFTSVKVARGAGGHQELTSTQDLVREHAGQAAEERRRGEPSDFYG
eukprot:414131-Hanusia_phi.AAC.1